MPLFPGVWVRIKKGGGGGEIGQRSCPRDSKTKRTIKKMMMKMERLSLREEVEEIGEK
jgi:hypothetical protein